ncbi:MAG: hypothetical protein ACOCU9_02405 [Spirochaetota bacterium]
MKRVVAAVVVLLVLGVAMVGAQEQTDSQIFGVELGFAGGYRLADDELVGGQTFALNLSVAPNVQAGLQTVSATGGGSTDAYGMFALSYFFSPGLGMDVLVGSAGGSVAGGAGVFFNLFESGNEGTFSSVLKLKAQYLFNVAAGVADGSVLIGLSSGFGL